MRWNCPHCSVALAVSDEKMGAGWTFSRCYKCGGFALIKQAEVSLIKIDRTPGNTGLQIPEGISAQAITQIQNAQTQQTALKSAQQSTLNSAPQQPLSANQLMAKQISDGLKPVVKASTRHLHTNVSTPNVASVAHATAQQKLMSAVKTPPKFKPLVEARGTNAKSSGGFLPEPLPEEPLRPWYYKLMPFAMGLAAFSMAVSGIYLYWQGQKVIVQTKPSVSENTSETRPEPAHHSQNENLKDQIHAAAMAPERGPSAVGEVREVIRVSRDIPKVKTPLLVQAVKPHTRIYREPSSDSEVLSIANPKLNYIVSSVKNDWFQILYKDDLKQTEQAFLKKTDVQLITGTDAAEINPVKPTISD